jgi:hypothetical protein
MRKKGEMGILRRENKFDKMVKNFEKTINIHEDQLFGLKLYLDGIKLMYKNNPDILNANIKSFQNIKKRNENAINEAKQLLAEIHKNPGQIKMLKKFRFPAISGHPMLKQMTKRAQILVEAYNKLFPKRPRTIPLSKQEQYQLMIIASKSLK